jgi:hypothetical protein
MTYQVFQCESRDLANELNRRDPSGKAEVVSVTFFGSAVHVVIKA